jgi:hypothetical protein
VLLGGVTALLPIYAKDVLVTGPWGLGLLRSAARDRRADNLDLAGAPPDQAARRATCCSSQVGGVRLGRRRVCVLDLDRGLDSGARGLRRGDAVSVVIRHSLVQTRTPHEMLGRVMAVNFMFTGTSGTLGEFRAGAVAACSARSRRCWSAASARSPWRCSG